MKKQEVIQQAYGKDYDLVKDHIRPDGWCTVDEFSTLTDYQHLPKDAYELKYSGHFIRPISLNGLETNNGWNLIEEKGNPEASGVYLCIDDDFEKEVKMFFNGSSFLYNGWVQDPTHWRPIVEIPKPLY